MIDYTGNGVYYMIYYMGAGRRYPSSLVTRTKTETETETETATATETETETKAETATVAASSRQRFCFRIAENLCSLGV